MNQEEQWLLTEKYHGEKTAGFFADCALLASGTPLAYIIGFVPFLDTTISLDSLPLIPRPETEYWVAAFIATLSHKRPYQILDLCSGSGCIGVAVGHALPQTSVDFVEIDSAHEATITKNWIENGLARDRMHVYIGNLFAALPTGSRYDAILTNPPYIDATLNRVTTSVREHEPAQALYGGEAGFEYIATIIREAPHYLSPQGELWIEHEPEQITALTQEAAQNGFHVRTQTDQYGVSRFSQLVLQ